MEPRALHVLGNCSPLGHSPALVKVIPVFRAANPILTVKKMRWLK
jgi:hypothetical protein